MNRKTAMKERIDALDKRLAALEAESQKRQEGARVKLTVDGKTLGEALVHNF